MIDAHTKLKSQRKNTDNKQMLFARAAHGLRRQPAAQLCALNLGVMPQGEARERACQ